MFGPHIVEGCWALEGSSRGAHLGEEERTVDYDEVELKIEMY
jgi:hypothetical protein